MKDFLVVDSKSAYNAIMGSTWLHEMKAVLSNYHQVLRFPADTKIVDIRGDQVIYRSCLLATLKWKAIRETEHETNEASNRPTK